MDTAPTLFSGFLWKKKTCELHQNSAIFFGENAICV